MKISALPIILSLGILAGCGESSSDKTPAATTNPPASAAAQKSAPPPPPPTESTPENPVLSKPDTPNNTPATATPQNAPETTQQLPPGTEQVKAEPGAGAQGKDYGEGIIVTPASVYFQVRERIFYDVMAHAMQLYKATEGHAPRTEKEFMEKIVKASAISLPVLPPGETYRYDPKEGELMIVRTKN